MSLNQNNMFRILGYLKSTKGFSPMSVEEIAYHLDKLQRIGQFEAAETEDGRLIYAMAWWRATDRILEQVKKSHRPKRIDRGRNIIGVFFINDLLGLSSILSMFRRLLKSNKAKSLNIWTARDKWVEIDLTGGREKRMRKKQPEVPAALKTLLRAD